MKILSQMMILLFEEKKANVSEAEMHNISRVCLPSLTDSVFVKYYSSEKKPSDIFTFFPCNVGGQQMRF